MILSVSMNKYAQYFIIIIKRRIANNKRNSEKTINNLKLNKHSWLEDIHGIPTGCIIK